MKLDFGMVLCIGLALLVAGCAGASAADTGDGHGLAGRDSIGDIMHGVEPHWVDGAFGLDLGMKGAQEAHPEAPHGGDHDAPVGVIFHKWKGFAIKGNDSHALRVSIESIRPLEPMSVRRLLASNMSLEQIREVIRNEEGTAVKRGAMKLSDCVYKLMDIQMTPSGNSTALEADLGVLKYNSPDNSTTVLGHLSMNLASSEIADVSQGTLVVSSGKYAGKYKVLLDTQDDWPPGYGGLPESGGPLIPACAGQGCSTLL